MIEDEFTDKVIERLRQKYHLKSGEIEEELGKQRNKLRQKLSKDDLNKIVNFWGKKITLDKAIDMMDKEDIKDAYKNFTVENTKRKRKKDKIKVNDKKLPKELNTQLDTVIDNLKNKKF